MTTGTTAPRPPHERLRDALGKPAVSIRLVDHGRWMANVFYNNGTDAARTCDSYEEALEYLKEALE